LGGSKLKNAVFTILLGISTTLGVPTYFYLIVFFMLAVDLMRMPHNVTRP
jgi:hypothetical protein